MKVLLIIILSGQYTYTKSIPAITHVELRDIETCELVKRSVSEDLRRNIEYTPVFSATCVKIGD